MGRQMGPSAWFVLFALNVVALVLISMKLRNLNTLEWDDPILIGCGVFFGLEVLVVFVQEKGPSMYRRLRSN